MSEFPNGSISLSLLSERFKLRPGDGDALIGECPVNHGTGASFDVKPTDTGWRITYCELGCLPREIWAASEPIDGRQPGEDEANPPPIQPEGWGFQSATEFLAKAFPPIRWLYMDLIPAESVTVVMAAPNAGKTFFGLDVVAQVGARVAADGRKVVIVEEEGTGAALQWRLSRALASVGLSAADNIRVAWNTGRSIRDRSHLASLARDCEGAELIMLDSLSALAGGINENDSEEMAQVAEALHVLKTKTGSAIMPMHHMTKAAWPDGQVPRLEHMRGHGALPGRADAVLALVPLESDLTEVRFELHCVKQRDGSKPIARRYAVAMTGPAATITISDRESGKTDISGLHRKILSEMDGKTVSKNYLCNIITARRDAVCKAVDIMARSGDIVEIQRGQYRRFPRTGTTQRFPDGEPSTED